MHEATLVLSFPDGLANAIHGALSPEAGHDVPKTTTSVTLAGHDVRVHVRAEDLAGLRAALNSYARWADAAARAAARARR